MGYETESWREPTINSGELVVFSEHGRSVNNVDFRSHWLMLVATEHRQYIIRVKHGCGEESYPLGYGYRAGALARLEMLISDDRYLILYTMWNAISEAKREASKATANRYAQAFVDGRLKKRRKAGQVTVTIDDIPPTIIDKGAS